MPYVRMARGSYGRPAAAVMAVPPGRRKRVWARFIDSNAALSELEYTFDMLSDFRTSAGINLNLPGVTIGRVRIRIQVRFDFSVVAGDSASGVTVGIYTQSQQSTAGRLSSASDLTDDYLYWAWHPLALEGPTLVSSVTTDCLVAFDIDSKAMRKMDEIGTGLFLNVQSTAATEIDGICVAGSVLLILP